jgi:hypothetical protein
MTAQRRHDDAYNNQKIWRKQQQTRNPSLGSHLSPGYKSKIDDRAERQNDCTKQEQPKSVHFSTIRRDTDSHQPERSME